MRKAAIIISIILIICGIGGLIVAGVAGDKNFYGNNIKPADTTAMLENDCKEIEINAKASRIVVKDGGEESKIEYSSDYHNNANIVTNNGKATYTNDHENGYKDTYELKIYVSEQIEKLVVNNVNSSILMESVKCNDVVINSVTQNNDSKEMYINIEKCDINALIVNSKYAKVEVEQSSFATIAATINFGGIIIEDCSVTGSTVIDAAKSDNLNIEKLVGRGSLVAKGVEEYIAIEGCVLSKANVECSSGTIDIEDNEIGNLYVHTNVGVAELSDNKIDKLIASTNAGILSLELSKNLAATTFPSGTLEEMFEQMPSNSYAAQCNKGSMEIKRDDD